MFVLLLPIFFLFLFGLAVGSFLNVVIYRAVNDDSPLRGRSYCDACKRPIQWYDNIPVLSFLLLRHRCRYCKAQIPWQYPAVEFLSGSLFVWWYVVGSTFFRLSAQPFLIIQPLFWLIVGILLVVIFFADLSYYIIPDSAVGLLSLLSFGYRIFLVSAHVMTVPDFWNSLAAGIGGSIFFLLLVFITKGKGMGLGDVKLAFPLGLLMGWPSTLVGFMVAFIIGALYGLVAMALHRKKLKSTIPFGPFLVIGTLIALLWGEKIITMYSRLL